VNGPNLGLSDGASSHPPIGREDPMRMEPGVSVQALEQGGVSRPRARIERV